MNDFAAVLPCSQAARKLHFEKSARVTHRLNIHVSIFHPLIFVPCSCRGKKKKKKTENMII